MSEIMLETKELGISFGGLKAVDSVNLVVKKGQLYGLIGPNGAGKTTIFNLITGVYKPTSGTFFLDGEELTGKSQEQINHRGIARTFQNIRLFNNMSVIRNVMVGLHNQKDFHCNPFVSMLRLPGYFRSEKKMREKAKELLRIFDLEEERNSLACNLPYGKQRKLEIARALATNPKLLLLDEPAAGMNPQETAELMDIIKFVRNKFNVTILLIEHDMKLVSGICEEVTVLNFGTELASGVTAEVLNDPKVITAYLGEDE
ncbi:MAG: ABC transporter ATP-binding protein [Clostridia bacterium]|nr:ABC transporter ATP-binding protein [Clostridia bacterium]